MAPRGGLVVVLSFVLGAAALVLASPASANDDQTVRGDCDGSSSYRLRVYLDDTGRLDVIGAVFTDDRNFWSWKLKHNGDVSAKDETRAKNDDPAVRVERTMVNLGGDVIVWRAENENTGEVCRGEIDF